MSTILSIFFVVLAYLLGSVCSAVIVSILFDLPDPRTAGSKNPGATNVLRLAGKKYAAIVLVADMLKGFLPVLLAQLLGASPKTAAFTCFAAVMGHMFPVFFDFKGGKGVATAIGALLGLQLTLGIAVAATWLLIAKLSRYASLASIITMILMPFYAISITTNSNILLPLSLMMLFILYQHRDNFIRLTDGTESKIKLHHNDISDITEQLFSTKEKTAGQKDQNQSTAAADAKKSAPTKAAAKTTKSTKKNTTNTTKQPRKK